MTILTISERIAALTDTHKEVISQIHHLSKLTSDTDRIQLAKEIHQTLRDAEDSYEELEDDVSCSSDGETLVALKAKTTKIGEDLKIARRQYRKAQLTAKANADALRAAKPTAEAPQAGKGNVDPAALFGDAPARAARRKTANQSLGTHETEALASEEITVALRRMQQNMGQELSRSHFVSETLALSTEALKDLSERYSAFDDLLGRSKEMIRDLVQKNKSDRWYYEKAVQMLLGLLVWIVIRRLFWGPIYLVLFMPVKSVMWVGGTTLGMVGLKPSWGGTGDVREEVGRVREEVEMVVTSTEVVVERNEPPTTMLETVGLIIEGGETTIVPNTKSRRFEYDEAVERSMAEKEEKERGGNTLSRRFEGMEVVDASDAPDVEEAQPTVEPEAPAEHVEEEPVQQEEQPEGQHEEPTPEEAGGQEQGALGHEREEFEDEGYGSEMDHEALREALESEFLGKGQVHHEADPEEAEIPMQENRQVRDEL